MLKFRVSADIEYLDGALVGLTIPAGFSITTPCVRQAQSTMRWLDQVRRKDDFIRAAVTGNRYKVVGNIEITGA